MMSMTETAGTKSLSEIIGRGGDTSDIQLKAFLCNNLGNRTILIKIPMYEFYRISEVANDRSDKGEPVSQRKLILPHATSLARYIIKGLLETTIQQHSNDNGPLMVARKRLQDIVGKQPYLALQPIVANLRNAGRNGSNLRAQQIETAEREGVGIRIWLGQKDLLWVVDGQHRRKAMQLVIEFLENLRVEQKYPPKKQSLFAHNRDERTIPHDELTVWMECYELTRTECTVSVDVHLGLDIIEERQLFHDLNNLSKKIETSMANEFDSANPINSFIKHELIDRELIKASAGDKFVWEEDDGSLSRKELVAIHAILVLNKTNISSAVPTIVLPRLPVAQRYWDAITQIPHFGEDKARIQTVAAQPVVLKAIAKLAYDFAFGRQADSDLLDKLLDGISDFDFRHDNPLWRYYQLSEDEIQKFNLEGLEKYLPDNSTGNRDVGKYDYETGWMRFGAKHNDIFPILGDMIRWTLNLPNRHE